MFDNQHSSVSDSKISAMWDCKVALVHTEWILQCGSSEGKEYHNILVSKREKIWDCKYCNYESYSGKKNLYMHVENIKLAHALLLLRYIETSCRSTEPKTSVLLHHVFRQFLFVIYKLPT